MAALLKSRELPPVSVLARFVVNDLDAIDAPFDTATYYMVQGSRRIDSGFSWHG